MKYPWNEDEEYIKSRYGRTGGHQDNVIDEEMMRKNIETSGGYQAKVTGDVGELALSSVLKSLPECYHVIDNILIETAKGSTQIDHVIVSPFGIFVVETKNHKGMIFGDDNGQVWTQVLNGRGHFKFYNPVKQNYNHMRHLSNAIKLDMCFMTGAIVFTNNDANLSNVNSAVCMDVDQLYYYILGFTKQIFSEKQVINIIKRIDSINKDGYLNRRKHVDYVDMIKAKRGY